MAELFWSVSSCSTLTKSTRTRSKISLAVRSEMAFLPELSCRANGMDEAEKPAKIPCSGPGNLVGCQVSHIRDGSRYFRNVRRLVSFSSMRQGSQKRRIGLHQQTVERDLPGRIAQVLRLGIAYISRERYQKRSEE